MNNISQNPVNLAASFPGLSGLSGAPDLSSLANLARFAFGALDIQSLASAIVDSAKSGSFSEELLELLSKFLSPVEMGQLLAEIEKLIMGDMGTGGAPAPEPNAADGGTGGETGAGNRTGGMTSGNAPVAATGPTGGATAPAPVPAAGSDTRITTRAPDSANIPALEAIANNPVVAAAIEKAWINSNPNGPGAKQEQGFWVMRDDKTGEYSIVNFPSNGTRDSLTPGAVPKVEGKSVVAFFHTHPNTVAEGYRNGPSPADQNFADARGIPGIIQSHDGLYFFNPAK